MCFVGRFLSSEGGANVTTNLLEKDLFQFGVPLMKSFTVDANGDVIVEGIASVSQEDHQGENLDPRGFVLNYFEKSGWIKWEHKGANNGPAAPNQFIGEPVEARITPEGQFYLKARLYKDSPFTQQVRDQLELLEKSNSSRKMGFSIEGQAIQRDPSNPLKVLKAIIRNVVLTMNPVNDGTWVALCKSLTSPEALAVDLDAEFSIEKAMDTGSAAAIMPQSLEGVKPNGEEDETVQALKAFRSYVKKLLNRSLAKSLIEVDAYGIVQGAYDHAADEGLDHARALEFASYVHKKRDLLKSVSLEAGQGGAGMRKTLAQILGESVEDLEKSLQGDNTPDPEEEELDALVKSLEGGDDEGGDDDADQDADEGDLEKGLGDELSDEEEFELQKSMSEDSLGTIDVSEFLQDLVKSINTTISGFSQDQHAIGQGMAVMARAMKAQGELIKSLQTQVEELGATPRGRRSAVTPNDVKTAQRKGGEVDTTPADELNKSQIMNMLGSAVDENKIPLSKLTSFEMGYPIDAHTAQAVGIDPAKNPRWVSQG